MSTPDIFQFPAIDLSLRNPASIRRAGLPPNVDNVMPLITVNATGQPAIAGLTLQSAQNQGAPGAAPPISTFDTGRYGDVIISAITATGAGVVTLNNSGIILPRPNNTRVELLIVNSTVAGRVYYAFGKAADPTSGVPIGQGGNRLWDSTVPQGDLYLYSTGAGIIIIEYMNLNVMQ